MFDDRLNFNQHINYSCEKAAKFINAVGKIMSNSFGPSSNKRRLLTSVFSSIQRYGGPARLAALETRRNRSKLNSTFRFMTMRVLSAYRTISTEAVRVIAGMHHSGGRQRVLQAESNQRCPENDESGVDGQMVAGTGYGRER
ncbi:uncharacterized protein LOC129773814 [Toxorhynchites rutilus septentrionalis]|uniref:uncharacterized protein LOC129773814 n=1 Tax=Toxorhynchites rutilus septentrionalis TaxID=329112 RepID=UPI0024783C78|nr:uncharacterized protein LOC129773814 [Toxorhynchites rutilus septentrionalis]